MNRIDKKFRELKKQKKKALIVYITVGYPDLGSTPKLIKTLEASGVDIIELGVPFSDPIADGPTIQYSSNIALHKGAHLEDTFRIVKKVRKNCCVPLVIMSYLNPIIRYGIMNFMKASVRSGIDGLIIPDLIPEEAGRIEPLTKKYGIKLIYLISPTAHMKRIKHLAGRTRGFIYAVSLTGVTGARKTLPKDVISFLKKIRRASNTPLAVGFGISNPAQAKMLRKHVDGIIIGSAVINTIRRKKSLESFLRPIRKSLN